MGLPVTGAKALTEVQGNQQLASCLLDTTACVNRVKETT